MVLYRNFDLSYKSVFFSLQLRALLPRVVGQSVTNPVNEVCVCVCACEVCVCVWGGGVACIHACVRVLGSVTLCSYSLSVSAPKKQGSKKVERSASNACGRSGGGRSRQPGVYVCVCDCVCIVLGTVHNYVCYPFLFPLSFCSQEAGQQCAGSGL